MFKFRNNLPFKKSFSPSSKRAFKFDAAFKLSILNIAIKRALTNDLSAPICERLSLFSFNRPCTALADIITSLNPLRWSTLYKRSPDSLRNDEK